MRRLRALPACGLQATSRCYKDSEVQGTHRRGGTLIPSCCTHDLKAAPLAEALISLPLQPATLPPPAPRGHPSLALSCQAFSLGPPLGSGQNHTLYSMASFPALLTTMPFCPHKSPIVPSLLTPTDPMRP